MNYEDGNWLPFWTRIIIFQVIEFPNNLSRWHGWLQLSGQTLLSSQNVSSVTPIFLFENDRQRLSQINPMTIKVFYMSFHLCKTCYLLTSKIASSVCPSLFFTCNILWVTCLYFKILWWNISGVCIFPPVCLPIHQKFPQSIIFGIFGKFH